MNLFSPQKADRDEGEIFFSLTRFHAALGLLAQANCDLTPHKEE
jgi:hypothetical protein